MLVGKRGSFVAFSVTRVGLLLLDYPLFETRACLGTAVSAAAVGTADVTEYDRLLLLIARLVCCL